MEVDLRGVHSKLSLFPFLSLPCPTENWMNFGDSRNTTDGQSDGQKGLESRCSMLGRRDAATTRLPASRLTNLMNAVVDAAE